MIGIVIVTHCNLGEALIEAAEFIVGSRPDALVSISIDLNQNAEKLRQKIADGIKKESLLLAQPSRDRLTSSGQNRDVHIYPEEVIIRTNYE